MGPHFRHGADTFERVQERGKVDNFYPVRKKIKALGYVLYAKDQRDGVNCVSVQRGAIMSYSQRSVMTGDVIIFGSKECLYRLIDKPPSLTGGTF